MTYEQMEMILANPGDYQEKFVEEAKKLKQQKDLSTDKMSNEMVDQILANPDDYQDEFVQKANEIKSLRDAGYSAPGKNWAKNYMPVNTNGGFNFNWREAYDKRVDPENLKSLQSLDDFRKSKMWNTEDEVNLNNIATELRFKDPKEKWSSFMASDRFPEFQKYLEDVRKYQTDKEVDRIFNEDGSLLVDFMLPVSKQYAMKNYDKINSASDMAPALAADAASNLVMTGVGKGAVAAKPILSHIYANAAAPIITEAGNVMINRKDPKKAVVNALEGYLVNRQTGKVLDRYIPKAESYFGGKVAERQKVIDDAVNAAVETQKKMKQGATAMNVDAYGDKHFFKWSKNGKHPVEIGEDEFLRSKTGHITEPEFDNWVAAQESIRRDPSRVLRDIYSAAKTPRADRVSAKEQAKMIREAREAVLGPQIEEGRKKIVERINSGAKPTIEELREAGLNDKESISNYMRRLTNESVGTYLGNAAGRPRFGQRGLGSFLETMVPGLDLFKEETENEKKSKLRKAYGL